MSSSHVSHNIWVEIRIWGKILPIWRLLLLKPRLNNFFVFINFSRSAKVSFTFSSHLSRSRMPFCMKGIRNTQFQICTQKKTQQMMQFGISSGKPIVTCYEATKWKDGEGTHMLCLRISHFVKDFCKIIVLIGIVSKMQSIALKYLFWGIEISGLLTLFKCIIERTLFCFIKWHFNVIIIIENFKSICSVKIYLFFSTGKHCRSIIHMPQNK